MKATFIYDEADLRSAIAYPFPPHRRDEVRTSAVSVKVLPGTGCNVMVAFDDLKMLMTTDTAKQLGQALIAQAERQDEEAESREIIEPTSHEVAVANVRKNSDTLNEILADHIKDKAVLGRLTHLIREMGEVTVQVMDISEKRGDLLRSR